MRRREEHPLGQVQVRGYVAALLLAIGIGLLHPAAALAQAGTFGQWRTLPYPMAINPIHAGLMNNGKVLVIAGSSNDPTQTIFTATVWDPVAGTFSTQTTTWDMFCNGMSALPDGRLFINGGNLQYDPFYGLARNAIFDPATNLFTDVQNMAHGRWYPTTTTLADGRVLSFSGLSEVGDTNSTVEIYTPNVGWSPEYPSGWVPPLYPRLHVLPNGTVFYSGSGTGSRFFNPSTNAWTPVLATTNYSGTRRYGTSVLLPLRPSNQYRAKVIIMGGGSPSTATTELIDLSGTTPKWDFGPPMSQPRIEMSGTILPNGRVLVLGGSLNDEDAATASLNADLYDPATNTMGSAGANAFPRLYHSGSLLLPDATVALYGGNPVRGSYEPHIEIYSPAYLFNADNTPAARPTITSVTPGPMDYNAAFQVQTPDSASIGSVVLVRPGTPTHAFDMDQRLVELSFTAGAGTLNVTTPPNANIAPPGYYMLFLLTNTGVPSVASFVQLLPGSASLRPTATIVGPTNDVVVQAGNRVSFSGSGSDPTGTIASYQWSFPGGTPSSSSAQNPGNVTYSTPGVYVATLTVTDSLGLTNTNAAMRIVRVPDFGVTAAPPSENVLPAGTASYLVATNTGPDFSGNITFSVTGLPAGATASFSPTTLFGAGSTTLNIATNGAAAGTYVITVRATSGANIHTTNVTMIIGGCDDTLVVSYSGGTLNLGFRIGTTTPGSWSTGLLTSAGAFNLWSNVSVPAIVPSGTVNFPIPNFPPMGLIYVITTLSNTGGASCVDWRLVDTGQPR